MLGSDIVNQGRCHHESPLTTRPTKRQAWAIRISADSPGPANVGWAVRNFQCSILERSASLQISSFFLFQFQGLKQGFEVSFAKAFASSPTDDFKK